MFINIHATSSIITLDSSNTTMNLNSNSIIIPDICIICNISTILLWTIICLVLNYNQ